MRDFTFNTYQALITKLVSEGRLIAPFRQVMETGMDNYVVLRHDVDLMPKNSVRIAEILHSIGVKGTFYFRSVPQSFHPEKIEKIVKLKHEVGYHYEDLSLAKGNVQYAIELFEKNLEKLRKLAEVKTICMHGSPLSKYDNRDIWQAVNYREYGIIGEPYLDIDFHNVLYLTDTGRRWDNKAISVRDKVLSDFGQNYKSSFEIIENINSMPKKIMLNTHPQRWNNNYVMWLKELMFQNVKNVIKKKFLVKDTEEY